MHTMTSHQSTHVVTMAGAALFAVGSIFISAGNASAKPNFSDYGFETCILYDGDRIGSNICCWEEPPDENGDSLGLCIKCKSDDISDCDVIDDPRGISAPRGGGLPKGGGTMSGPAPKPGPRIKLNRPKNRPVLR